MGELKMMTMTNYNDDEKDNPKPRQHKVHRLNGMRISFEGDYDEISGDDHEQGTRYI